MEGRIWLIPAILAMLLSGCLPILTRPGGDGDKDLDVPIVAQVTDSEREKAINYAQVQVNAVGLVVGLSATGDSPQGPLRGMLERELRKQKVEHVREILDSKDNAMVLVSAMLHRGMRKGDPIDVEITLPPNSRATSLRGGRLLDCYLRDDVIVRSSPNEFTFSQYTHLSGDILAKAAGQLLVGLDDPDAPADLKRGRIWEGGVILVDRPYFLILKRDDKSAHVANAVAERLNGQFREDAQKIRLQNERFRLQENVTNRLNQQFDTGRGEVARPSKESIALNVPFVYCLNPERYLRVSSLVPLREAPEQQLRYRQKLALLLQNPKDAVRSVLRLEALGQESIPTLKAGLESPHPLVRFASAEALTYLGSTAGVDELANLAQQHRQLRYWSLLALANLNESVCRTRLNDLLNHPDPELRYGAFFALRLLSRIEADDREEVVSGRKLGAFWLHRLAPRSPALVHLSLIRREEIVLFGSGIQLRGARAITAGTEFTITVRPGVEGCTVCRVPLREERRQQPSSLRIDEILRTLAELGAQYPDVVDFLRRADKLGCLSCPLRIDAGPERIPFDTLAQAGRDANFLRND